MGLQFLEFIKMYTIYRDAERIRSRHVLLDRFPIDDVESLYTRDNAYIQYSYISQKHTGRTF